MEVNDREENIRKLRSMYRHLYLFGAGKYCNYLLEYIGDIAREVDKRALRSSRGGNAPNMKIYYSTETLCPLPFVQMVIRPDGKVSLCCNDALGENTLGDINKNSLLEIWNSDAYREVRETVKNGRYGLSTCRYCNTIDNRELWKTGQYGV